MTNNDGIVLDAGSGISVEEQQVILSEINGIAEKNRRSLSQGGEARAGKKQRFKAKKNGGLFPIMVNVVALVLLGAGFFLLSSFQEKTEVQVREGANVYTSAERALIDEIRKETEMKIAAKETEIARIVSRLGGIDAELKALYSSREELTAEQRDAERDLLALQDEYRAGLAALQDERAQILEESRAREAALRAQFEAGARELVAASQQNSAELNAARSELERLANEQEKAAAIEAHLSGGLASASELIRRSQFSEAAESLKNLRLFLNTPAFQAIRPIQAKKEFYTQAINSMETLIEDARRYQAGTPPVGPDAEKILADLQIKNTQLEETIAGMNKTIAAFSSDSSGQARRLRELEASVSALRTEKSALETSAAEKDRTIRSLESDKTTLNQTVSARDNTIRSLESDKTTLNQTVSARDNTIRSLESDKTTLNQTVSARNNTIANIRSVVQGKTVSDMTIGELSESISQIMNLLQGSQ